MQSLRFRLVSQAVPLALAVVFAVVAAGILVRTGLTEAAIASVLAALLLTVLSLLAALGLTIWFAHLAAAEQTARVALIAEAQRARDSVSDGVLVYDSNWRFIFFNKNAAIAAQKPAGELLGHVLWKLYPELVGGTFHQHCQAAQRDQQPRSFEIHYAATGQWLEVRVFPTPDRITVVFRDISAQQLALEQRDQAKALASEQLQRAEQTADLLREANRQLGDRNRQLQEFTHIASHDLQAPLRKIRIFGEMLREHSSSLGEAGDDYLRRMLAASVRMQSLISSLLAFARAGTSAPDQDVVDLSQLISDALGELIDDAKASAAKVVIHPLPKVVGDSVLLRQAMQNLLANAIKFTKPGEDPRIEIGCETFRPDDSPHEWCRISFRDHGIGFDPAEAERIFDMLQRLHGRASYEGSGIGLTIVRRIVESHGGRVRATAKPGEGACFQVELPLLREVSASAQASA